MRFAAEPPRCSEIRAKKRGKADGFDRTLLTPDWTIIETQLLRLAPPTDDSSLENIINACEEGTYAD
ncbi:hypothetical protein SAMN05443247_08215 [Bradyrhizobium erythrophlei]|jgi:hypothetical protein|nr:hypothetical protein SAMN05443247_08215 [Bradyrhizobium erythrophlei]